MEYTLQAQNALEDAKRVSRQMHHHYIGTEHLLVGLVDTEDGLASRILLGTGVTANALLQLMDELIYPGVGVAVMEEEGTTPKLEQLLEQAQRECAVCGMEQVGTEHLLLAMLKMQDCAGAKASELTAD